MTQQQNLAARESNERNGKDETVITAIEVKNEQARLKFLPSKLGRYCIAFENAIYNWMTRNAVAYNGSYWDFYQLSNGGFYLKPTKGYMLTSPNGLPMMAFLVSKGAMAADDLMAAGREDAEASFGEDSTLIYYFMLAEVVLVFLMYLRNHNPATFVLIPVFFVITGIIFAIIKARAPGVTP